MTLTGNMPSRQPGYKVALRRQGWQLETVDALIATVALQNNLILLTTDHDFGPISELQQENWLLP